jgi:hypothetical protein
LQRVVLNEQVGCRDLAVYFEVVLIVLDLWD